MVAIRSLDGQKDRQVGERDAERYTSESTKGPDQGSIPMKMNTNRRTLLKGLGGALTLPLLEGEANAASKDATPTRFLVVGNPLGMHPEHFFPQDFGRDFTISPTLRSLDWLKDRMTILSHADHGMNNGHGREIAFLNGVLPVNSLAYPEKNISVDQVMARHTGGQRSLFIDQCGPRTRDPNELECQWR